MTYLLLSNPVALQRLTVEVRSAFENEQEITMTSVNQLTYMLACLNEALRVYPPVPAGLPRVTPAGGRTVLGRFVPQGVSAGNQGFLLRHTDMHPRQLLHCIIGHCIIMKSISQTQISIVQNAS